MQTWEGKGYKREQTVHPQILISPESLVMIASPGAGVVMKLDTRTSPSNCWTPSFLQNPSFRLRMQWSRASLSRDVWVSWHLEYRWLREGDVTIDLTSDTNNLTSRGLSVSVIQNLAPPANKCPGHCPAADSRGDVFNRKATFPTSSSWSPRFLFKHSHTVVVKNLRGRKLAVFENPHTESRLYSN